VTPIDYDGIAELYDSYAVWDHDLAFFVAEARRAKGPVLELMAGTGRVSLPLAAAGVRLTCVDASAGMLAVLSEKLAARELVAEVVHADVRALALPAAFDLALLPFNAFMELVTEADQRAALAAVAGCLKPGGRFVCTLHNPAIRRRAVDGTLRVVGRFPAEGGTLVVSGYETGGDPVVTRLQFLELFGEDGRSRWRRLIEMRFTLIERDEFERAAVAAGFRVVELFGGYDRSPFDPATSPSMIWILDRPS
jgi:SAM-dependent methyltransferase